MNYHIIFLSTSLIYLFSGSAPLLATDLYQHPVTGQFYYFDSLPSNINDTEYDDLLDLCSLMYQKQLLYSVTKATDAEKTSMLCAYLEKIGTITSKQLIIDIRQQEKNKTEYERLHKKLLEYLSANFGNISLGSCATHAEKYLKQINTPISLMLLDDLEAFDDSCNEVLELMVSDQYIEAIQSLNDMLEFMPMAPILWEKRGVAYLHIGNFQQAINDFTNAINLFPMFGVFYYERALAYDAMGNFNAMKNDLMTAAGMGTAEAQTLINAMLQP